jgi:cell division protein FtsB
MENSGKNIFKKALGSKVFLFFALLVLIFLTVNAGRESYNRYQLSKEISRLEMEKKQIEKRNSYLAGLMNYYKDESYLEEQARLKLNLKKSGENVVVIERSRDKNGINEEVGGTESPALEKETANYWKWWEYFFE